MITQQQYEQTDLRLVSKRFIDLYYILVSRRVVRTRKEFCDAVGLDPTAFSQIENGKVKCTWNILWAAIKAYDVQPFWLFMAEGQPFND